LSENNAIRYGRDSEEPDEQAFARKRAEMVHHQIEVRGIRNERVLEAMSKVPRHLFVPHKLRDRAYCDTPLHIGEGQTISQPYMVALMTEMLALTGSEKALEVGTGSGYQTAILAELAEFVHSIDRIASLAEGARQRLAALGYDNVEVHVGDGSLGLESEAPFDAIIVTAGAPGIPAALCSQLAEHGKLLVPVGSQTLQRLHLVEKMHGRLRTRESTGCVFVPLIGEDGWTV
jgi:protein-L-isoaspartate(D-aspartate) O-methyltransferase